MNRNAALAENTISVALDTRERLMRAALSLFAAEGINAVALRRIVAAAGAGNASALHYHFGGRDGLLTALVESLRSELEPRCLQGLAAISAQQHDVSDVVVAAYRPYLELSLDGERGRDAIRFLARLTWESGPKGQSLLSEMGARPLRRALELLCQMLPSKDPEAIKLHLIMNMSNLLHGLADQTILLRSPFGRMSMFTREPNPAMHRMFFAYMEAGLRSMS